MTAPVRVRFGETASAPAGDVDAALAVLSAHERARYTRFAFAEDRRDFALAHALLRRTLSECHALPPDAWTFVTESGGKPALSPELRAATSLSFSISHTRGLVACAVARDAIAGIDVERIDARVDPVAIARRFFSSEEAEALERRAVAERHQRFAELWTLKEAYLKALGDGLSGVDQSVPHNDPAWTLALFAPSPRYRMAVAVNPALPLDCSLAPLRQTLV